MLKATTITAMLALPLSAGAAHATFDFDFKCADGSTMSYSGPSDEVTVRYESGAAVRMPGANVGKYTDKFALFPSPGAKCEIGSPLAPCAEILRTSDDITAFHIIRAKRVECTFVDESEQ